MKKQKYFVVTVPHSDKLSITEKLSDAEEIAENWRQDGFSTLIETVAADDLTECEKTWIGVS